MQGVKLLLREKRLHFIAYSTQKLEYRMLLLMPMSKAKEGQNRKEKIRKKERKKERGICSMFLGPHFL